MPAPDPNSHGLPELTDQQKYCCLYYMENRCSKIDAYNEAYPGTGNRKKKTAYVACGKFFAKPMVKAYLRQLEEEARKEAMVSVKMHINELRKLRDQAVSANQFGAAVTAETNIGKVCGLYNLEPDPGEAAQRPGLFIRRPTRDKAANE